MSVRRSTHLNCDICGQTSQGDLGMESATDVRNEARLRGWHVNRPGGRDLCPFCWDEGSR